ncbi:MAG TPA: type IX secretion system sortase PorU, partial [Cyclobacteriaceae bacterium]
MKNTSTGSISLFFTLFLMGWGSTLPVQSQNSILQSGAWYKLAVEKNGVYKIDRSLLSRMGFDPAKTDPRKIKIYGNEGGMLPQANNVARPIDLIENAIYVHGENDGVFNTGDYVLFYAQGPDKSSFSKNKEIFYYEKNLYADKNFYFVTVGDTNGKRILTTDNLAGTFPVINQFENFSYYELNQHSELKSGREWYGEKFDLTLEFKKEVELGNVVPGSTVKLVSDVMAKGFTNSSFTVLLNGTQVLQQAIAAIPNTLYGIKGRDKRDTVTVNANTIGTAGRINQEVMYRYTRNSNNPVGYLDYFLLQVTQQLALYSQQTSFRSAASLLNPASTFEITNTQSQTTVWDVTNPYEPLLQSATFASGKTSFSTVTSTLKEFIAFSSSITPTLVGAVSNQNLHGMAVPNFVIVVHPDFKAEAERLSAHRSGVNGIASSVATTEEVYNEFSSGRQDVTAIRDFAKSLYDRGPGTLKAVLLFGKGSYDYKDRLDDNTNFVPIYESRNSLNPLTTYSSDDYFSFLENNEGEWAEEPAVNHTMDIAVGRFPVKTATEARKVVDKIIEYDLNPELLGKWRKEIAFVADDGDFNLHQDDANQLAEAINDNHAEFNTRKIYLDQYPQESRPSGQVSPETKKRIEETFYNGALVINYTGHGNERLWADERIFDDIMIASLENKRLPLMVTATCEFGRQDDPEFISGAELMLLREGGGAISLVTTSRP